MGRREVRHSSSLCSLPPFLFFNPSYLKTSKSYETVVNYENGDLNLLILAIINSQHQNYSLLFDAFSKLPVSQFSPI